MSPRRKTVFKLAAASLAVLLALALAEILGRAWIPDVFLQRGLRDSGLFVPFEERVEADLLADEFRVRYRINAHGLRDPERSEARRPGTRRLLLFGDSFTAGWGVEHAETYGALLEARTGAEHINLAKNGGNPLWFIPQLRAFVPRFGPDAIVVQVFDNDPDDCWMHKERFGLGPDQRLGDLPEPLRARAGPRVALSRFVRGLVVRRRWRAFRNKLRGRHVTRSPFVRVGARPDHVVHDRASAIKRHEVDLSRARAFHPPETRATWTPKLALERALLQQLFAEARAARVPLTLLYLPQYQVFLPGAVATPHRDMLRALCAAEQVPFVDGQAVLGRAPDPATLYYAWDGHLNPAGHRFLAAALEPRLHPKGSSGD